MAIFFVKSLYRMAASGRPENTDRNFHPTLTLVEERVVMFDASDSKDALAQAKREARAYARETHRNPYGQIVKMRFLNALSAYELWDPLQPMTEVYSDTEVFPASTEDSVIVARRMGHVESDSEQARRINVAHAEFYVRREVPASTSTRRKRPSVKRKTGQRRRRA